MALRAQILGKSAIKDYLARTLGSAPFGKGSRLRHVVGGDKGGGFEWIGGPSAQKTLGVTTLELDAAGKISRVTIVYDGRTLDRSVRDKLLLLSLEP